MRSRRSIRSDEFRWRVGGVILLFGFIVIYGFPIFWMVSTSFKTPAQSATVTWWPSTPVVSAYQDFFAKEFLPALGRSLRMGLMTVGITMSLATTAAYGLARSRSRLVTPLLLGIVVVQLIPPLVTFLPLFRLLGTFGLLNSLLGVSLAQSSMLIPFAILLLRPAFAGIPPAIEEAASIDGANSFKYLLRIALPLARNTIAVVGAICFVASWGDLVFPQTLIFTEDKAPISSYIALAASRFGGAQNALMAVATLVALPIFGVVMLAQRQLKQGLVLGSVK